MGDAVKSRPSKKPTLEYRIMVILLVARLSCAAAVYQA